MKSMSANKVWDLEEISKGAKTVGCLTCIIPLPVYNIGIDLQRLGQTLDAP